MIEQRIEQAVADAVEQALSAAGVDAQVMACLSPASQKGLEEDAECVAVVKASPRQYSTSTIPTCEIPVEATVLIRADADADGEKCLSAFGAVVKTFEGWQKCYDDVHERFSVDGEFRCEGFRLDSGSFTSDQDKKVWQYGHSMTVIGVVQ